MRYSISQKTAVFLKTAVLLVLGFSSCRTADSILYPDINLNPRAGRGSTASQETIEGLLFEIWDSGFFKQNYLVKEEILNNTYGVFRKPRTTLSEPGGRAYFQSRAGQKDLLMLNARLFKHIEPTPKPAHMKKVMVRRLDENIRATIVHELFHDFWNNLLDEKRRQLFTRTAEIFYIELVPAETTGDTAYLLDDFRYDRPEQARLKFFEVLNELKDIYGYEKAIRTELYATLAGLAYSGITIIPESLKRFYVGILSDESLGTTFDLKATQRTDRAGEQKHNPISSGDHNGFTSLHHAAFSGNLETVEYLIKQGLEVNARAIRSAWTPIFVASLRGHEDIAARLIAAGARTDITDIRGRSPIHIASLRGHERLAGFLCRKGARIDSRDALGMTPLHAAAYGGHEGSARLLISLGADAKLKDFAGQTPLHLASMAGDKDCVAVFAAAGVFLDEMDSRGETAMHIASRGGDWDVVAGLIELGADPGLENGEGDSPRQIALRAGHTEIVDLLTGKGAKRS
jgi:ankyrin repeat protein